MAVILPSPLVRVSSKGFILTLDALVALTIFFLAMLAGLLYISQPDSPRSIYLKQVSQDVLIIGGKQSLYSTALSGNGTSLRNLLRAAPPNICLQMALQLNSTNQTIIINNPSCTAYAGTLETTWGSFYRNGTTYNVRLDSWYR